MATLLEETEPDLCVSCKNMWGAAVVDIGLMLLLILCLFYVCLFNCVLPVNIIQLSLGNLTSSSELEFPPVN